jgi:hypothetical protein
MSTKMLAWSKRRRNAQVRGDQVPRVVDRRDTVKSSSAENGEGGRADAGGVASGDSDDQHDARGTSVDRGGARRAASHAGGA